MTAKQQLRLGDLELSVIDPFARDTEYIYEEIFTNRLYEHPNIRLKDRPTIVDVGANIGIFSIWAAGRYKPAAIYAYEASPTTYEYLVANVERHIDRTVTTATCLNFAVSKEADKELELHQAPYISGLSTMLDGSVLPWVEDLRSKGELYTHKVRSTTLSRELTKNGVASVDLLKIDVEGHFMEVLDGLAAADFAKVRNIVLEAEYAEQLGHSSDSISAMLRGHGFAVEAKTEAQLMVYAWRD